MWNSIPSDGPFSIRYVLTDIRLNKCVIRLLMIVWLHYNLFLIGWFVTSKMITILFTALYADENIL